MLGYDWPRLHAALNDLPAALLLAAVFFDLIGAATRRPMFRQVGFWTLVLGVVGAAGAVLSGLEAEGDIAHGDAVHRVMGTHKDLGLITFGLFLLVGIWRVWRERRMGVAERTILLTLSVGGVVGLFATGMYGGRLVFDHAAGISSEVLRAELQERTAGHAHAAGQEHGHGHDAAGEGGHQHDPPVPVAADSGAAGGPTGAAAPDHVDPPGTPPHDHGSDAAPSHDADAHSHDPEPRARRSGGHSHPPGTPPHED